MTRTKEIEDRLKYLRGELRAERISYGELAELQGLAAHITPGDVELLEAAGVPEFSNDTETLTDTETRESCGSCGADVGASTVYPWHREDEDCRAVHHPLTREQVTLDLERYGHVAAWR